MTEVDRRKFLRQTAAGMAGAAMLGGPTSTEAKGGTAPEPDSIPPHRPLELPGLHAYAEKSVASGETIHFRVSSGVPYQLSVCRLGLEVDRFEGDEVIHTFPASAPGTQAIHPGSYIYVENGLPPDQRLSAMTLECWVRPWSWDADQGLMTTFDPAGDCGFALFLGRGGWVKFYLGDGGGFQGNWLRPDKQLKIRQWHHLALVWDGLRINFYGDGEYYGSWGYSGVVKAGRTPLRLGAAGSEGRASDFFDGDMAMPVIYDRALTDVEVKARYESRGLRLPLAGGVMACWPFEEERGDRVKDASGHGRNGRIINRASWMIGGPSFDSSGIPRYGSYDPEKDAIRGHGLRFASDDLYDCRWRVTHEYRLPKDAKSGIYVGRIRFESEEKPHTYHVTIIVKKAADRAKSPILMLCSSNTWLAYSTTPFAAAHPDRVFWDTYGLPNSEPTAPAYSCYRSHRQGQPTYAVGMHLPWPVAGPDVRFSQDEVGYSHLMRGERFAHQWLSASGYDYDVITDYDLHLDPGILNGYKVLIINGHSEYWSIEAYQGVDQFLRQGGSAIVMSGNTMFWRVSYDDDGSAMECRKYDTDIGGCGLVTVGELFHSHDKKLGSMMRESGHPAWKVLGLECIGWWEPEEPNFGAYKAVNADHFLFHEPVETGLQAGEQFGQGPSGMLPRAGGHESDARLPRIREITKHTLSGVAFPEEPPGIVTLAQILATGRRGIDYYGHWEPLDHGVIAEMIYWERRQGGRVFHGGCIATGWALSADAKLQTLMRNVLHHFGVTPVKT